MRHWVVVFSESDTATIERPHTQQNVEKVIYLVGIVMDFQLRIRRSSPYKSMYVFYACKSDLVVNSIIRTTE